MNHETLDLKEAFGPSIEFPNEAGVFQLDASPDLTAFIVLSQEPLVVQANFASTPNASAITSTTNTSIIITTRASRNLSTRALACVKIVRADLDNNGKPSNLILHNHTVHVNIYSEEQACVTYLLHKIRQEMVEEYLVLVGASGLVIYDQDSTRGKLLASFFVTLCRAAKTFCPLKLTSQGFGPFFSKNFSPPASPVATVFWSKIHLSQTLRPVPTLC